MDEIDALLALYRRESARPSQVDTAVVTETDPLLVNSSGSDESAVALQGVTPAVGDVVLLLRARTLPVVVGKLGRGTAPRAPEGPPLRGSSLFPAAYAWSWRAGRAFDYEPSVRQGAMDSGGAWAGAWFYQGMPGAELAGATVTGCAVRLSRGPGGDPGAQDTHLSLSSSGVWPTPSEAAPATVGAAQDVSLSSGQVEWVDLPTSWGQAFVDDSRGLMVSGADPMVLLTGVTADPESGLLRIDWERSV